MITKEAIWPIMVSSDMALQPLWSIFWDEYLLYTKTKTVQPMIKQSLTQKARVYFTSINFFFMENYFKMLLLLSCRNVMLCVNWLFL